MSDVSSGIDNVFFGLLEDIFWCVVLVSDYDVLHNGGRAGDDGSNQRKEW